MKGKAHTVKRIGEIGIDAGLCWIGDPCYILHANPKPTAIGKDWRDFCRIMAMEDSKQFNDDKGHPGLGVVVSTGYGDGLYPVYAEFNEDGRIASVFIAFILPDDATEEA